MSDGVGGCRGEAERSFSQVSWTTYPGQNGVGGGSGESGVKFSLVFCTTCLGQDDVGSRSGLGGGGELAAGPYPESSVLLT